jgi:peptidoglycan/LPS O-acetylase OafA/YrhL
VARVPAAGRDRYFDTLRVVAIIRVVLYHAFPAAGLELVFPSMGVMFALGGSLMVKSLDRDTPKALRSRVRRLLPALWAMGLIIVPVMLHNEWVDRPEWWRLLLWAVPIADPPSSELGYPAAGVLWYLVTYLWLVLLSPMLLALYRRLRLPSVLIPLAALILLVAFPQALSGAVGEVVQNILAFASCWMLGMAHREGDLMKLRMPLVLGAAALCVGGSLGWAFANPDDNGVDLTGRPVAYTIYSIGFVLALLRWAPQMAWLARIRPLDGFVSMVNNRAVTIYLWHNVAITAAVDLFDPLQIWRIPGQVLEEAVDFALALSLVVVAVLAIGWVEDVAARRPARVSPFPQKRPSKPTTSEAAAQQTVAALVSTP